MPVATSAVNATRELAADWKRKGEFEINRRLDEAEFEDGNDAISRARNAGTVISVVVIGVVALVGLLIFGEVYNAMPIEDNGVFGTDGALEGTPEDIVGGFSDALGLVPIILIVLLASVVIGVVQRMRR